MTAVQEYIPGDKLSRVISYDALGSFVLGPIGLLLAGPVSAALGIEQTLIAAGSLVAIGNLGALFTRSVRQLPAKPRPRPPRPEPEPEERVRRALGCRSRLPRLQG
jgi:hypothetical protein